MGEFLFVLLDQCLEPEHHAGAALWVDRGPSRLRRLGDGNCLREDRGVTVLQDRLHLSGGGIVDGARDGARPRHTLAVDEVADGAHRFFLPQCVDVIKPHART